MSRGRLNRQCRVALCAGILGLVSRAAGAADHEVTASGTLLSVLSDSGTFDGTAAGTLPPLLDLGRLQGGSFRATYRFTQVRPESGTTAFYELSASSGMTSYELLDRDGLVVHRGGSPSGPVAILSNNYGGAPFVVDQVLLGSEGHTITGLNLPAALYSPRPDFISHADFNLAGYVGAGVDYLSGLSIPTDAATYLAFPAAGRSFNVGLEFGDGDYIERLAPYQLVSTQLQYDITTLTVTAVPEPAACLLLPALAVLGLRRVRRVSPQ